jgi:hypothetical protein
MMRSGSQLLGGDIATALELVLLIEQTVSGEAAFWVSDVQLTAAKVVMDVIMCCLGGGVCTVCLRALVPDRSSAKLPLSSSPLIITIYGGSLATGIYQ